jgi:hypothetical protein
MIHIKIRKERQKEIHPDGCHIIPSYTDLPGT